MQKFNHFPISKCEKSTQVSHTPNYSVVQDEKDLTCNQKNKDYKLPRQVRKKTHLDRNTHTQKMSIDFHI